LNVEPTHRYPDEETRLGRKRHKGKKERTGKTLFMLFDDQLLKTIFINEFLDGGCHLEHPVSSSDQRGV
jgi:hypothetical protein